jgi:hypothetical protein
MKRRALSMSFLFLVLGVWVSACGSSSPAAPTPTPAAPPTVTAPSAFTLSGLVTDGFSGGILPGIDVLIMNGPSQGMTMKTDGSGHYALAGVQSGTYNVQFSAVSYVSQVVAVPVSSDTTINIVLQRS